MNLPVKIILSAAAAFAMASAGIGAETVCTFAADAPSLSEATEQYAEGNLEGCTVKLTQTAYNYAGAAVTPEKYLVVSDGGKALVKGTDYTVSYKNNDKPGAAEMTVTGKGDYNGSVKLTFIIRPAKQKITGLSSGNGGIRVEWDTDKNALGYQVLYSQDMSFKTYHSTTVTDPARGYVNLTSVPKAGETWYVKVRAFVTKDGNVKSTRYGYYSDVQSIKTYQSIDKVTIPYSAYTWTGKARKPSVKVKDPKGKLIPAANYTVTYSNNINVGTAKITVTGKGSCAGTYVKEFVIKPAKNEITSITTKDRAFKISWKQGTPGTVGYQVLYSTTSDFSANVHSYTSSNLTDLSENFSKVPKAGETWYVKVRSFYTKDGKVSSTRYGNYSDVKSITVSDTVLVTTKAAKIYKNASFSPDSLGSVGAGASVSLVSKSGRWYKVSVNGITGWIYNKAFGVSANYSGRITADNVGVYADDVIFDIGTSPAAIMKYVLNTVKYAHLAEPAPGRDGRAAYAFSYRQGACYHYAAASDMLLEHAGYVHKIVEGRSTSGEHNWNIYMTASGWRYLDACPFIVYPSGFADFTGDQVKNIRSFTWDRTKYET